MKKLAGIERMLRMVAMAAAVCAISACGGYDDMGPNPPWNLSYQTPAQGAGK